MAAAALKGKYVFYIWWKLRNSSLAPGAQSPDFLLKQNRIHDTPAVSYLPLADRNLGKKKNYNCCFSRFTWMFSQVLQVAECLGYGPESILQINFHTSPESHWNIHLGTIWEFQSYLVVVQSMQCAAELGHIAGARLGMCWMRFSLKQCSKGKLPCLCVNCFSSIWLVCSLYFQNSILWASDCGKQDLVGIKLKSLLRSIMKNTERWSQPSRGIVKEFEITQTCRLDPPSGGFCLRGKGDSSPGTRGLCCGVRGGRIRAPLAVFGSLCSQLHSALKYLCWPDGKWRCVEKGVQTVDLLTPAFATWLRLFKICDLQLSHSLPIEEEWKVLHRQRNTLFSSQIGMVV